MTTNRVESTVAHWKHFGILALTICCITLLPFVTASPPLITNVVVSATNTTSFTFDVVFSADAAPIGADEQLFLDVLIQPAEGNATEQFLPLTNPMQVILTGLLPDSIYSFTFQTHNNNGRNSSDVFTLVSLRTYRLGPQIIGLFASDPSPTTDPADSLFSNGDVITIAFDQDTNQPAPLDNQVDIAKYFSFSQPIGDAYSAAWGDARTLNIVITDVGQGAPNLGLGYLTVTVVGPIFSPDGKSDISTSTSPPLIGSWAAVDANYFQPINPTTQQVITNPDFRAYLATSLINQDTTLPIKLIFPATANKGGYMIAATVVFPKDLDLIGFTLKGQNFTTPSTSIGTDSSSRGFTNDFLSTISSTVVLTPKKDYVGYSCVQFQLFDRSNGYAIVDTSFVNVRFTPPPPLAIPELQLGSPASDATSNPITLVKKNQTAIIIGVCVTLGVILLAILSVCGWKRYKAWKGERDFEGVTQPTLDAADKDNGPTRRFYFDSKM